MKFIVCLSLLVLMVYLVQAHPVLEEEESVLHSRQKRATCDLFSYGGKVNHSACAAHCLLKGFRGGNCSSKAVCNCRR